MDSGFLEEISRDQQTNNETHVIWGSAHRDAACVAGSSSMLKGAWSGPCHAVLINVKPKKIVISGDLHAGINSASSGPNMNASVEGNKEQPHAASQWCAKEQEVLMEHGSWSVGSQVHVEGTCRPCHYVHTSTGCKFGFDCNFCHLPHAHCFNRSRNRPCRKKRDQCKQLLKTIVDSYGDESVQAEVLLKKAASKSAYMQSHIAHNHESQAEKGGGASDHEAPKRCTKAGPSHLFL